MKIGSAKVVTWSGAQYPGGCLVRCSISRWPPGKSRRLELTAGRWRAAVQRALGGSKPGSGVLLVTLHRGERHHTAPGAGGPTL